MNKKSARFARRAQEGLAPLVIIALVGVIIAGVVVLSKGNSTKNQPALDTASQTRQTEKKPSSDYSNFDYKISIQTPSGWQLKENPKPGIHATFFSPREGKDDKFIENVNLHLSDLSIKPNATVEETVEAWKQSSKSDYPDSYELVSEEKTTLAGVNAIKIIAKARDGVSALKGMTILILKDSKSYILNYSAEEKSFDKFLPDVEKLLQSVKLEAQKLVWEDYKSEQYGYSVRIPKGWKVTDTPNENKRETSIVHPQAKALVLITALKDEGLKDINYMKDSIKAFKEKLEKDPATLQVAKFTDQVEGNTGGFIAIGEEKREGQNWYFEQRGLLGTSGKVLLFHGAALSSSYKDYKEVISDIIESFTLN